MLGFISFIIVYLFAQVITYIPYAWLRYISNSIGWCVFYLHTSYRKKAMTNLSVIWTQLSEQEKKKIAIASIQHLCLICLELFHVKKRKILDVYTTLENPLPAVEKAVFFSGHQGNWFLPFLKVTQYHKCIAIAKPFKNKWMHRWMRSLTAQGLGSIITPKHALTKGLIALKEGCFLGMLADQAVPHSSYSYPFLGLRAWSSHAPALVAYKARCPLIAMWVRREGLFHRVFFSPPLYADYTKPMAQEVKRLMDTCMHYLEEEVKRSPQQWMWIHNRWKQQVVDHVKAHYRHTFIVLILPPDIKDIKQLEILKKIYPRSYLTILAPPSLQGVMEDVTMIYYHHYCDLFLDPWKFQMVIDLYGDKKVRKHYKGAVTTLCAQDLGTEPLDVALLQTLCTTTHDLDTIRFYKRTAQ